MHKLEEVKARGQTTGGHKMYLNNQKRHTTLLSFWEKKLSLSRFRLGPSVFLKNRTILLPKYEFHQKRSQRFNMSQPQPRSHMCASMISDQN